MTFAAGKNVSELLIAHPELTPVREAWLTAVDYGMEWAQANAKLIAKTIEGSGGKHELELAGGLLWFTVIDNAARPTPESEARKVDGVSLGPDPHLHAHVFLSSLARPQDDQWQKVDGKQLWQTAETRAQVVTTQFNRLLEEQGLRITYGEADLKGRMLSQIEGSNTAARVTFSTNSARRWQLQLAFESEFKKPPTEPQIREIMAQTKAVKSKVAKEADELGNLDQVARWRLYVDQQGIELTITAPGPVEERESNEARLALFFQRLEQPSGVASGIEAAAVFGPEVFESAADKAANGLGYPPVEMADLMMLYRDTQLVVMRDAIDPSARLYTTKSILAAERQIAEGFGMNMPSGFHRICARCRPLVASWRPNAQIGRYKRKSAS